MKKLINLVALVMLVSTNVFTPFSYAQEETPEVIPENEVGNVEEIGETREKDNEITVEIPNSLGEVEGEGSLPLVREVVNETSPAKQGENLEGLKEEVEDSLDAVESPTTDENKDEDTEKGESDKVAQQEEENAELEKQEEGNIGEEKENIETEDLLLKSLVDTELYAVDDPIECGSGYVLNADGTGCELIQVTFNANGGNFNGGEDTKTGDTIVTELPPVRYSHTANINDDGVASSVYANNLLKNDVVTIPGATSLNIEVRFATESASYDWLAIYPKGRTPSASNYGSATISNGKLAGHGSYSSYTKPSDSDTTYHRNFTVAGDTAQFYFKSDSSTAYYGYYAIISGVDAGNSYVCSYDITAPTREGYIFDGWYVDTGYTQIFNTSESECLSINTTVYAKWYQPQPKDIILEATATSANQILRINKYFANAYTVHRGDGTTGNLTADIAHTYVSAGTYTITLSTTADRWTFGNKSLSSAKPLVPTDGTTVTGVKITNMPSLLDGFGYSTTAPGNSFFHFFNYCGALTSLPVGSFDTSNISGSVGNNFFSFFNYQGQLTSLPVGSFDTSNITKVGNDFFSYFNRNGKLTSLPTGSFNTSNISGSVGSSFFDLFNDGGQLMSLPAGSFDISNITAVGNRFFYGFEINGTTSLPEGSFDTSNITTVGDYFFAGFNGNGTTSLPEGSFDTSNITTVGDYFFSSFNAGRKLTSLPEGSFDISNIRTAGNFFFDQFNSDGLLTSLPDGSFNTSNISGSVGSCFFRDFNRNGKLTSLPTGSFDTSSITSVGESFFGYFNENGSLTSLPVGSFDTSNITSVGWSFFNSFNNNGQITTLPEGSFNTSNIMSAERYFFNSFNNNGQITSLPDSFTISSVGAVVSGVCYPNGCHYGYSNAFNSSDYSLNRKVSNLVSGVTEPLNDSDVFSDNQPGRCGVHENWLVTTADACSISYDDGLGGTGEFKYTADTTGVTVGSGMVEPKKVGYIFSGWIDASGNKLDEVVFPDMDGQIIYAQWTPNEYTITFEDSSEENEKIVISGLYLSDTSSIKYPKWTKEGYKIVWDKEIPATMPAENMIIKASWEKNGYSGGGGGGGATKPDTPKEEQKLADSSEQVPQNDNSTSSGANVKIPEKETQMDSQPSEQSSVEQPEGQGNGRFNTSDNSYTNEQKEAYEFAKENGITTMATIQKADMSGKLTRIQMAKMLSQYAINVLGQTPDTSKTVKFSDVTAKRDADYDNGVTLAYQLGIMGQNMKDNKFRPNDEVSRAEFVTALSRLLYSTSDGEYKSTSKYYTYHMEKLVSEGIITKADPSMKERRGYVMIMLMRSSK